jgi:NADPH:quinone reductase-like Zn-dependent oxidoreductase
VEPNLTSSGEYTYQTVEWCDNVERMRAVAATGTDPRNPAACVAVIDRDMPAVPDNHTLVKTVAASINHHDIWFLRGMGMPSEFPHVLGCDLAGTTPDGTAVVAHALIADVGRGGGDELLDPKRSMLADIGNGTFAEYVSVPTRNLVPKPDELEFVEAACLPTTFLTAYRMLFDRADIRPGNTVLVQGAGGGVSTAAVILGRAAGLKMWVTSRSEDKLKKSLDIGADAGFETGARLPARVDAVLETVGEATWEHSMRSVRPGGTIVVAGWTSGFKPTADLSRLALGNVSIRGSAMGRTADLRSVLDLCSQDGVRPVIDATYTFENAYEGFARLAAGEVFGKLVVTP